jgi:hypothetical protein
MHRSRSGRVAVLGVAALLAGLVPALAGCGGSSGSTGTSGSASGAAAQGPGGLGGLATLLTPPTGDQGAATSPGAASTTSIAGLPPVTSTRTVTQASLDTPTRNIGCYLDATRVRCDIDKHTWNTPPRPADCQLDYGTAIELGTGRAAFGCVGDTVRGSPDATVFAYDTAVISGDYACVSTRAGVACRNTSTGHGFTLSKEAEAMY